MEGYQDLIFFLCLAIDQRHERTTCSRSHAAEQQKYVFGTGLDLVLHGTVLDLHVVDLDRCLVRFSDRFGQFDGEPNVAERPGNHG